MGCKVQRRGGARAAGRAWALAAPTLLAVAAVAALAAPAARAEGGESLFVSAANANAAVGTVPDLCAPCLSGSLCFAGVCTDDANNSGNPVCSQFCQAGDNSCPAGFSCQKLSNDARTICVPDANTVCAGFYKGAPTNTTCYVPASVSGLSADLSRTCVKGDTCYLLPVSGTASCVTACSRTDADLQCAPGLTCCWAQNADGSCITQAQAGVSTGGCFLIRQPGQSCVVGEQSVCAEGATCLSPTADAALSVCYRSCTGDSDCIASEKCSTFGSHSVCCDSATFDGASPATCHPATGTCLRQLGVACDTKADCVSGLCFQSSQGGVCSQVCATNADCPAPNSDVNGDGVADGGMSCRQQVPNALCIPNGAIAAPPACATASNLEVGSQTPRTSPSGGCAQAGQPGALLLALAGLWLWRRRSL